MKSKVDFLEGLIIGLFFGFLATIIIQDHFDLSFKAGYTRGAIDYRNGYCDIDTTYSARKIEINVEK